MTEQDSATAKSSIHSTTTTCVDLCNSYSESNNHLNRRNRLHNKCNPTWRSSPRKTTTLTTTGLQQQVHYHDRLLQQKAKKHIDLKEYNDEHHKISKLQPLPRQVDN
eukprot:6483256-Amphidinium_carterae.1